jgi:phospholipid transport system substrate-binding protein
MRASVKTASAILVVVALLDLWPGRADATPGSAIDKVRAFYAELLKTMRHAASLGRRGRYQALAPVVQGCFDVRFMTRVAIGPTWDRLTPEQQQRVEAAFGRYITATYASEFDGYSGEHFKILDEREIRSAVLVRTQLVKPNGEAIALNYVMSDNNDAWRIHHVYLNHE